MHWQRTPIGPADAAHWVPLVFLLSLLAALVVCQPALSVTRDSAPQLSAPLREPIPQICSLKASIETALKNYPTIRYARARVLQTQAGITLARTAYLPTFDVLLQELRTTRNVIAGSIFPQTLDVIPIQSGRETNSSTFGSIFGSNVGANFSWELYDFGLRNANVMLAKADRVQSGANVHLTELDVASTAAETYLETVANKEKIRAQEATVARMKAYNLVVHTLVDKGLRPGVDASRADADLSFAKIALIEAERDTELARVNLAESMGVAGSFISVDDAPWIKKPAKLFDERAFEIDTHPLTVLRAAEVSTASAQVNSLDKTWRPHIYFHSAIWGRGSGATDPGHPVAGGTIPSVGNWVAGFSVSFPVLDYYAVRARRSMAAHNEQAQQATYDLAVQQLMQKDARARVLLDNARRIADETPILIKAAKDNESKALTRYRTGLCNIVEVAEAERILERAQAEDAVAEVRVWRSILAVSYAQGDLRPFMNLVSAAEANP